MMVLGADELSRSITSATWQFMLDDDRKAAYRSCRRLPIKRVLTAFVCSIEKAHLVFTTDPREQPNRALPNLTNEVCATCHTEGPIIAKLA
jgi:hypothetical protein